jgi:hypothetical protein
MMETFTLFPKSHTWSSLHNKNKCFYLQSHTFNMKVTNNNNMKQQMLNDWDGN